MNEYSVGAMEALSWIRSVLRKCKTLEQFESARKEIEKMTMTLSSRGDKQTRNKE